MTLIKMSYMCQNKWFFKDKISLILFNFISITRICTSDFPNNRIHYFWQGIFFYLILVMFILSFIKKYSIYNRNLFSIILFCSIVGFNLFVITNNAYILINNSKKQNSTKHLMERIKNDPQWYLYMTFLNIYEINSD